MGDKFEFVDESEVTRLTGTLHDPAATVGQVLTVQADKSIKAAAGGASGGVQVVTVPISSAQILDIKNTPVTIVAGVAGNAIMPVLVLFAYIAGGTPYTDGGGFLTIATGAVGGIQDWFSITTAGWWDQAASQIFTPGAAPSSSGATASYAGVDLVLGQDTAAPTLGNGTLKVTVAYFLAPTV